MSQFLRDEFRNEVDEYIRLKLMPMLSQNERNRLTADFERTKTNPLTYPMVLRRVAELADEHPLLGLEPKYADFDSLPMEYQSMLRQLPETKFETVNSLSGRWPDFPLAVTKIARDNKVSMKVQLGPSTLQEFSPEIEAFVANKFSPEQRKRLKSAEGLWPEYPKLLHEAAKTSRAAVPGLSPPGEFQMWERFRTQRKFGPGDRP